MNNEKNNKDVYRKNNKKDISGDTVMYSIKSERPSSRKPSNGKRPPKKKKNKKRRIIILSIIAVIVLALVGAGVYAAVTFSSLHRNIDKSADALGIDADKFKDVGTDIDNILLLGIDDDNTSDSMMILSVDRKHNKIKLNSLLRDSFVKIEATKNKKEHYGKLNEVYNLGGASLSLKTVNQNFGLNLTEYASVKFKGMASIIDAVGGIDMEVTEKEADMLNGLILSTPELKGEEGVSDHGKIHLNGTQAVSYSRIRKVDNTNGQWGDYGRTDRQRAVMEKLFEKARTMPYNEYPGMINKFLPYMETSLNFDKIIGLAGSLTRPELKMEQTRTPKTEYTINAGFNYQGGSTVYYDVKYAGDMINAFIYEDISNEDYMAKNPPKTTMMGPLGKNGPTKEPSSSSSSKSSSSKSAS